MVVFELARFETAATNLRSHFSCLLGSRMTAPSPPADNSDRSASAANSADSPAPASMVDYAVLSDVGMRRANNQDAATVLRADTAERYHSRGHLFVVADGMGAHAAGELASRMAVDKIPLQYLKRSQVGAAEALRQSVEEANNEIHRRGQQNPEFHNMGTTASARQSCPMVP